MQDLRRVYRQQVQELRDGASREDLRALHQEHRDSMRQVLTEQQRQTLDQLVETARRELLEETGYQAESMDLLLSGPTSAGMTSEITHLFLATGLQQVSQGGGVGGERGEE